MTTGTHRLLQGPPGSDRAPPRLLQGRMRYITQTSGRGLRNPHGKLASRKATLMAMLRFVDPRADPQSKLYRQYEEQSIKEHLYNNGQSIGWAIFDKAYKPTGPTYCLQITLKRLPVQELCYSSLLASNAREQEFQRIGLGCPTLSGWYNSESKSLITIV
jgi:hypothetical protein